VKLGQLYLTGDRGHIGVKRQELEVGSPFKNEWSKTSTLMEWCLIKHSGDPTLFL
jgi:hypothetical protein